MRRRQPRWRTAAVLALAVAGVATASGCSGDGDETDRLAEELVSETAGALDGTQAACVAEGLSESFGDDSYREVIEAAEGEGEAAEDVRVEVIDIFASCGALEAVVLDPPTNSGPG